MQENSQERIEKLLALILIHDMRDAPPGEKALMISRAGFSPAEIGALLGQRANTISVQILRAKRSTARTGRPRKKATRQG